MPSNIFSLQKKIEKHLYKAVILAHKCLISLEAESSVKIPLRRFCKNEAIIYRSSIAFVLSRRNFDYHGQNFISLCQDLEIFTVAQKIVANLCAEELGCSIKLISSGWIEFQPRPQTLAFWLQELPFFLDKQPQCQGKKLEKLNLFPLQYVHARCCSLLRLAHRQGLILSSDSPISWLDDEDNLRLVNFLEWQLIDRLLDVVDNLEQGITYEQWYKIAINLSQSMVDFYDRCGIWREAMEKKPLLAEARLGLIIRVQLVLAYLLEEKLAGVALEEV